MGKKYIKGLRTNCMTLEAQEVQVEYEVKNGWLTLVDGVTGYECIELVRVRERGPKDWCACMGTPLRWDRLIIDGKQLEDIAHKGENL